MLLWRVNWIKKIIKGDAGTKYDKGDNHKTRSRRRAEVFTLAIRKASQDCYLITNKMYFNTSACLDSQGSCDQPPPPAKHTHGAKSKRAAHLGYQCNVWTARCVCQLHSVPHLGQKGFAKMLWSCRICACPVSCSWTLTQINYICALLNKHIDDSFLLSCSNLAGKSAIYVACPWISGSAGPSAACGGLCLKGEHLGGSRVMLRCFPDPHSHCFFSKESEGFLWRAWRWDFGLWDGLWVTKASGNHARPSKAWGPAKKEDVMPSKELTCPLAMQDPAPHTAESTFSSQSGFPKPKNSL